MIAMSILIDHIYQTWRLRDTIHLVVIEAILVPLLGSHDHYLFAVGHFGPTQV